MKYFWWIISMALVGLTFWLVAPKGTPPPISVGEVGEGPLFPEPVMPKARGTDVSGFAMPPAGGETSERSAPSPAQPLGSSTTPADAAFAVDAEGVLRKGAGEFVRLGQPQAQRECAARNMRLPTIRELVQWKGHLAELGAPPSPTVGYVAEKIFAMNPFAKPDAFYAIYRSNEGTLRKGEIGNNWFWSSSLSEASREVLSFNDDTGYVSSGADPDLENSNQYAAIRCVAVKANNSEAAVEGVP